MSSIITITASDVANRKLSTAIDTELKNKNYKSEVLNIIDLDLPLYTTKYEQEHGFPAQIEVLQSKLAQATGMIFVAPEYNGSYPPVLNNFIAWMSRSSKNWRDLFNDKPAALATHSGGGGEHVLLAMRQQLAFIGMNVIGRQLLTHYQKPLKDESLNSFLDSFLKQID